jgi:hypothetical protein
VSEHEYVQLAGSGEIRVTTQQDVALVAERRASLVSARRPRAMVASAVAARDPQSKQGQSARQHWQEQAIGYVRVVPELSFASRFYAKMMRDMLIYPALLEPDGGLTRIEDNLPVSILNRIQDPGGGIGGILASYGRLMFITGEGFLFGRDLNGPNEKWSFVWSGELEFEGGGDRPVTAITHKPNSSQAGIKYKSPGEAVAYRMWTPDPGASGEAESPMRASLQVARELITLTAAVEATANSRIPQGIFVVPQEIAPAPAEAGSDEDPLIDPFMEDLVNHLVAQRENIGTPEAAAPFVFMGAHEYLDALRMIQLHDTQNDYAERELRREAVERLSQGLDMPKEMLTGVGQTNHWAAKQIMDDRWRSHGSELGQQFCNDLNQAYFRPALKEAGWDEWARTVVAKDDSQITQPADMLDAVKEAFKDVAISRKGVRHFLNIPDDFAPDPTEEQEILEILKVPQPAGGADGNTTNGTPPPAGPEGDSGRRTRVVASAERERGVAELALLRCRALAGRRIRTKERQCPDCLAPAKGKPETLVASAVGDATLRELGLDPRVLVSGGTDELNTLLSAWGYSTPQVDAFCEMIEHYAARTLCEETADLPAAAETRIAQMKELVA